MNKNCFKLYLQHWLACLPNFISFIKKGQLSKSYILSSQETPLSCTVICAETQAAVIMIKVLATFAWFKRSFTNPTKIVKLLINKLKLENY